MELGDSLYNQSNYTGAFDCYNKAIELGYQTNAPVFTKIVIHSGYLMNAIEKNNKSNVFKKIYAGPINAIENQPNFCFDISNPNKMHMRISNIYVCVSRYNSTCNEKIIQNYAKGYNKGYSCNIKPILGNYKCILTSKDYDFINIAPNELEHAVIDINADTPGVYELTICLDYAIGGVSNRIIVERVPIKIGFFNDSQNNEAI
jgi:hypothetical protein